MHSKDVGLLKERALQLLRSNLKSGYDPYYKRHYRYVCPSLGRYPWQWFWDSCFHAVALSHLDMELAKSELYNLVATQEPGGFIGHVIFWKGAGRPRFWARLQSKIALHIHHTAMIQPPVLAQAVQRVYERSQDRAFLREVLPRVMKYYRWLASNRDPDGDGLIAIISNYESGLDHLPAYDRVLGVKTPRPTRRQLERKARALDLSNLLLGWNYNLRRIFALDRFNVEDVMMNCIYAEGLDSVAELAKRAGMQQEAQEFSSLARKVERAILEKCYDKETGAFYSLSKRSEAKSRVLTVTSLFPLVLQDIPRAYVEELARRHLQNPEEFWLPYPVPSVARCEPSFEPEPEPRPNPFLWRGPTWINTNWFLVRGLRRHGYGEMANALTEKSVELVLKEGFREFYNPLTGKGLGAVDFGWSTLVVDMVEQ